MLDGITVLVVEDEALVALEIASVIEDHGGIVLGPVARVIEALALLRQQAAAAAILDANLLDRDITPVAFHLVEQGIPFVIHTGTGIPHELKAVHPDLVVVMKPAPIIDVINALHRQICGPSEAPRPSQR